MRHFLARETANDPAAADVAAAVATARVNQGSAMRVRPRDGKEQLLRGFCSVRIQPNVTDRFGSSSLQAQKVWDWLKLLTQKCYKTRYLRVRKTTSRSSVESALV